MSLLNTADSTATTKSSAPIRSAGVSGSRVSRRATAS